MAESFSDRLRKGLSRLTGRGAGAAEPTTRLDTTTRWLESLPQSDVLKSQQAIHAQLKRMNDEPAALDDERIRVLMALDERARDLQTQLIRQYLRNPRMSRMVESQLWHAVYALFWETARGYHRLVIEHSSNGARQDPTLHARITLRALLAFGQLLKWRAVRYLGAGDRLWHRLHRLMQHARTAGFARTPLAAYADLPPLSCEAAYLHAHMLVLAHAGSLYPKQLDHFDRWLWRWHGLIELDVPASPTHHVFAVDPDSDQGAFRIHLADGRRALEGWSPHAVLADLAGLTAALKAGQSPAEVGLGEEIRTREALDLLAHLARHWGTLTSPEQRRAPREPVKRLVDIVQGLSSILETLAHAPSGSASAVFYQRARLDADRLRILGTASDPAPMPGLDHRPGVERWVVHDESACGFGATVESGERDWLRVGVLLALRIHGESAWRLGVIRRLSRHSNDTYAVGIETLANTFSPVTLTIQSEASVETDPVYISHHGIDSGTYPALWLDDHRLILDPARYRPAATYGIELENETVTVSLDRLIERSEGWMLVGFKPANRSSA